MTGRQSLVVRAARLAQTMPWKYLRPLEQHLIRSRSSGATHPPLIILLALPRSGSTLTYQSLIHAFQPAYLSNFWNLLYSLPAFAGLLSRKLCDGHESDFESAHGFVEGICGPAEGLRFWSYWTGWGLDENSDSQLDPVVQAQKIQYLRAVLAAIATEDAPLVTGYLGHALVPDALYRWFPHAVFVRLRRDLLSNAASILRCRKNQGGEWFSVVPRECVSWLDADIHTQVAAQVYWLNRRLDRLPSDAQVVDVTYEGLCTAPNETIQRVAEASNRAGMNVRVRKMLPSTFDYSAVTEEAGTDAALLAAAIKRIESQYGRLDRPEGED